MSYHQIISFLEEILNTLQFCLYVTNELPAQCDQSCINESRSDKLNAENSTIATAPANYSGCFLPFISSLIFQFCWLSFWIDFMQRGKPLSWRMKPVKSGGMLVFWSRMPLIEQSVCLSVCPLFGGSVPDCTSNWQTNQNEFVIYFSIPVTRLHCGKS